MKVDVSTAFALVALILVIVLFLQRPGPRRYGYPVRDRDWWPATWNYDWRGGPGYDRHIIRRGADHVHPGPPRSTPGGDGRPRR
jgi:hypothetical protein